MSKRNNLITICAACLLCAPALAQVKTAPTPMAPATAFPSRSPMATASAGAEPVAAASSASNPARTTLEQMAAYARQAQQAAALAKIAPAPAASAASSFAPPVGPISYPPAPRAGGTGGEMPNTSDDAPRLVSIMGTPGNEQAQIALGGYIYTVSTHSPSIGDSHWALTRIDVAARAVQLHKTAAKKGDKAKDIMLGFAVRDPDTPVMLGSAGIPGAMVPPAPFAGGMR